MPIREIQAKKVVHAQNAHSIPLLNTDQMSTDTKYPSHLIDAYNYSMGMFNALIQSLANVQLDRDSLRSSLASKVVVAKNFLSEYLVSIHPPTSTLQEDFDEIDRHLLKLKSIPLIIDPLFVFDKVRNHFDSIRTAIKKKVESKDPSIDCNSDIAVQYITHLRKVISSGIEYFQAHPYFPPQSLNDWLPKKGP